MSNQTDILHCELFNFQVGMISHDMAGQRKTRTNISLKKKKGGVEPSERRSLSLVLSSRETTEMDVIGQKPLGTLSEEFNMVQTGSVSLRALIILHGFCSVSVVITCSSVTWQNWQWRRFWNIGKTFHKWVQKSIQNFSRRFTESCVKTVAIPNTTCKNFAFRNKASECKLAFFF